MKKFILFTLLSSLFPMIANADPVKIGNLWYNLNEENHTAEVCRSQDGTSYSGSIVIPETIYGKYAVTSVGNNAFLGCSGLTSITIPNSMTSIGNFAFQGCSGLTSITIPNRVTAIGNNAFEGCDKLERVYITDLAAWCNIDFNNDCPPDQIRSNPLRYAGKLYLNGTRITKLTIPETVTEIKNCAFIGGKFTSLTLPNTITKIGASAFQECNTLRTATINNVAETGCQLTTIGNDAFSGCGVLESVNFTGYPTVIGQRAFWGCASLTSVELNDNLTTLSYRTFYGCSNLTTINIPSHLESIEDEAFLDCLRLQIDLYFPEGLTSIGNGAFSGCSDINNVRFPSTLTHIGDNAFRSDNYPCGFHSIYIPSNITSIGSLAFAGLNKATSVVVAEDNPNYDSRDNCNAIIETSTGTLLAGCRNTIIPDGVTTIDHWAMSHLPNSFFILPNSVEEIKEAAFDANPNLKTLVLGSGVTDIDPFIAWNSDGPQDVYCFAIEDVPMADVNAFNGTIVWGYGDHGTLHVPAELIDEYRKTAPWNLFHEIVPITGDEHFGDIDVTIGAAGYATFSNGYTLDFTGIEGLTAYVAKGDKSQLIYENVGAVPAGTGLLLAGEEGTYQVPVIYSAAAVNDNLLVGTGLKPSTTLAAGDYLLQNDPVDGIGFYRGEGKTLGAGKAYLHIDGAYDVKSFRLPDIATDIQSIEAKQENGVIYNLAGQRVQTPARGLYIVNGKKVVIK